MESAMKRSATPFARITAATLFCACFFGGSFLQSRSAHAEESNFIFDVGDVTLNVDPENRSGKTVQPAPKLQQRSISGKQPSAPVIKDSLVFPNLHTKPSRHE
jgi:hypothetical protein